LKGEGDVAEARDDPGIILPLSFLWWWGGWGGIKTRNVDVQLVPKVVTTHGKKAVAAGVARQRAGEG